MQKPFLDKTQPTGSNGFCQEFLSYFLNKARKGRDCLEFPI